jgi:hypothetical protein
MVQSHVSYRWTISQQAGTPSLAKACRQRQIARIPLEVEAERHAQEHGHLLARDRRRRAVAAAAAAGHDPAPASSSIHGQKGLVPATSAKRLGGRHGGGTKRRPAISQRSPWPSARQATTKSPEGWIDTDGKAWVSVVKALTWSSGPAGTWARAAMGTNSTTSTANLRSMDVPLLSSLRKE